MNFPPKIEAYLTHWFSNDVFYHEETNVLPSSTVFYCHNCARTKDIKFKSKYSKITRCKSCMNIIRNHKLKRIVK